MPPKSLRIDDVLTLPKLVDECSVERSGTARHGHLSAEAVWLARGSVTRFRWPTLAEQRERRIREAAYLRAERRGFAPGHEVEDWLDAEQEVDRVSRPLQWG
ncbi:MAG: DUF2934 domain-containing protein [Chromatiaceae bacterium]